MSFNHSFLIFKILLLLAIVSCSVSYGQALNNCLSSIEQNKMAAVKWPYIDSKYTLNDNYWLTPKQLLYYPKDILWVDIRAKGDKEDTRLVDVLHLSVTQLEDADFLFDKAIVLIGTGFDQLQIDKTISQLRKKGFKHLFALAGGIRTWRSLSQQKLSLPDEISPQQFLLGSKSLPWKVITIGLTVEEVALLPERPFKQVNLSDKVFLEITQLIKDEQLTHSQFISLVLITKDKNSLQRLKQQLPIDTFSKQLVWLQGGLSNYQNFIEQQHKVIASKGSSLSRPCGFNF